MEKDNIQEQFLDCLKDGRRVVTVITINGFQLHGRITGYDQHTILIEVDGQQQLVYKTAISTIREA